VSVLFSTAWPRKTELTPFLPPGGHGDTLVLFGSEFGRMPTAQGPDGRDHNITGYRMWLAGAGVKKGFSFGGTDEFGIHATHGRMHITELHANAPGTSWPGSPAAQTYWHSASLADPSLNWQQLFSFACPVHGL